MRIIIITSFLLLGACSFEKGSEYQFGAFVSVKGLDGYNKCTGILRNRIAFDYYQVDSLWCDYTTPKVNGAKTVSAKIFTKDQIIPLFWRTMCYFPGSDCFTPIIGSAYIPEIEACEKRDPKWPSHFQQICNYEKYYWKDGKYIKFEPWASLK